MEYLGLPADEAIFRLKKLQREFKLRYTVPTNKHFAVDKNRLYVVRVKQLNGILELVLAAKMQKEV